MNAAKPTAEQTYPMGVRVGAVNGNSIATEDEVKPTTLDDPPNVASVSKELFS